MDSALGHDGQRVDAIELDTEAKLHEDEPDWLPARRREGFTCPSCGIPVYFVRTGLQGRGRHAHFRFGATQPHQNERCEVHPDQGREGRRRADGDPIGAGVLVPGVRNRVGIRELTFAEPGPLFNVGQGPLAPGGAPRRVRKEGPARKYVDTGEVNNANLVVSFRRHLENLRDYDDYPTPDMRLAHPERGQILAADYFRHFSQASTELATPREGQGLARLMAYWAEIEKVKGSKHVLFIDAEGMGITVKGEEQIKKLQTSLGIDSWDKLVGCYILAEGRLAFNSYGSAFLLNVTDLQRMAVVVG